MSLESVIQEAIEKTAKDIIPVMVTEGTVVSVDKDTNTCTVERDNLPELFKVRLNAITSPGNNCFVIYPKVGSNVLVLLVENNRTDGYLLTASEIDQIIINGGSNGGLPIIESLVTKLNELVSKFNSHVHSDVIIEVTGGSGSPAVGVPGTTGSTTTEASEFASSDFENNKIKH